MGLVWPGSSPPRGLRSWTGIEVVEVDRPNRQVRRKKGKSDPTDAVVAAARAALSGEASVIPKARNGPVEQMRVLLVARRSARQQRIQSLTQLRHLVLTAPEPIRMCGRLAVIGVCREGATNLDLRHA
jgi:hypothetical protein